MGPEQLQLGSSWRWWEAVELVGEGLRGGQRGRVVHGKRAGARSASSTNPALLLIIHKELDVTMAFCGHRRIEDVGSEILIRRGAGDPSIEVLRSSLARVAHSSLR